jgi:Tol biopolymer transport system component
VALRIAFTCGDEQEDEICVINADGTGFKQLTNDPKATQANPAWSPDGSKIIFDSNREGGRSQIYVMSPDGSGIARVTHDEFNDAQPRWSPDGSKIAFFSNREGGNREIYIMDADGSNQRRITNNPAFDFDASWTPDGEAIVFTRVRGGGGTAIFLIKADGSGKTELLSGCITPAILPDGAAMACDGPDGIHLADLASGKVKKLTSGFDHEPAWSPDGSKLAFRKGKTGPTAEIYLVNADGSGLVQLTHDSRFRGPPSWSPLPTVE